MGLVGLLSPTPTNLVATLHQLLFSAENEGTGAARSCQEDRKADDMSEDYETNE
jgi:hypothetical protein